MKHGYQETPLHPGVDRSHAMHGETIGHRRTRGPPLQKLERSWPAKSIIFSLDLASKRPLTGSKTRFEHVVVTRIEGATERIGLPLECQVDHVRVVDINDAVRFLRLHIGTGDARSAVCLLE